MIVLRSCKNATLNGGETEETEETEVCDHFRKAVTAMKLGRGPHELSLAGK
jgi:hypothetical protein